MQLQAVKEPNPDDCGELTAKAIRCGNPKLAVALYLMGHQFCGPRYRLDDAAAKRVASKEQGEWGSIPEARAHSECTDTICHLHKRMQDAKIDAEFRAALVTHIDWRRSAWRKEWGRYETCLSRARRAKAARRFYRLYRHWFRTTT